MTRFILTLACTAAALAMPSAQVIQPATSEPHHTRLLYTNDVRVFDVVVPPGQSTADYSYDHDFTTVVIGTGNTTVRGPGSTVHIDNSGAGGYHAIEVENMRA